ncbi:MAG: phosphoribosylaminoimidazolecarboxamide formyltransferase, partial [Dehalococcoidia bacterium DG_18]
EYDEGALSLLKRKRDLRIFELGAVPKRTRAALDFRRVGGGFLAQTCDFTAEDVTLRPMTERQPTPEELRDLLFAWRAVKHVKSNAIVLANDLTLLGMGAGQPSRVDSVEIALKKAGDRSSGSVLASDAFFPFPDGVELAAKGGITAIIQPGGSVRDEEAIRVANEHHIAMVFTGMRHFKH